MAPAAGPVDLVVVLPVGLAAPAVAAAANETNSSYRKGKKAR